MTLDECQRAQLEDELVRIKANYLGQIFNGVYFEDRQPEGK